MGDAFTLLRGHARRTNQRLVDLSTAGVIGSTDLAEIDTIATTAVTDAADHLAAD